MCIRDSVHGVYTVVDSICGDTVHMRLGHEQQDFFSPFSESDRVRFIDPTNLEVLAEAIVKDVYICGMDGLTLNASMDFLYGKDQMCIRDSQYTHLVYSFLNFYFSPLSSLNQQDSIRSVLSAVAEKCIREVVPENDYNMLREDGTIGKVNKMWGDIGAHEWMRLPMFYLAAYAVTEDRKYKELYDKYRDKALENSLSHDPEKSRCYCSLQMQLSLRAVYDYDTDNAFRSELLNLMKYLAQYGENKSIQNSKEFSDPKRSDEVNYRFCPWNKRNLTYRDEFGGYKYYSCLLYTSRCV